MEPTKPVVSQKEYLKRYLMKDQKKKVKKKKSNISSSTHIKRSVIIDDDINIDEIPRIIDDAFSLEHLGDEAPQIAGIIDERPEEMKLEEKYKSGEWKPLKPDNRIDAEDQMVDFSRKVNRLNQDDDLSPPRKSDLKKDRDEAKSKGKLDRLTSHRERSGGESEDSDLSPRRKSRRREGSESREKGGYVPRQEKRQKWMEQDIDSDLSPPRSNRRQENSPRPKKGGISSKKNVQRSDSDLSPPRHNRGDDDFERRDRKQQRSAKNEDKLRSKSNYKSFKETEKCEDSDLSPPRTKNTWKGNSERRGKDADEWTKKSTAGKPRRTEPSTKRQDRDKVSDGSDSDLNVPRNKTSYRNAEKGSSRRGRRQTSNDEDSDLSPPRRGKPQDFVSSRSRNRGKSGRGGSDSDLSPPRKRGDGDSDLSPARNSKRMKDNQKRSRFDNEEHMQDGKKAGLQDAKSLKDELRLLKKKEDEMFRKMDPELLGRSTAAVVRDRKTGLKRDLERERQIEREKNAKNALRQQKYDKWGKGLKQVREHEEKKAEMVHEMSKPLARYADDDDLERALKAQEREGDPMLDYIKRHQKESVSIDLTVGGVRKKYMGSYLPNRFNVAPGHRWDGVDRSNGYEQKWFEAKNAKKATAEEAWKWSSSDM
uniref:BUD13 homolog n=1 Tax=Lygus hesperus TaxID=30085 RepID=A0A146LGA4_LYGHE